MIKITESIWLDSIRESDTQQLMLLGNNPVMRKNVWDSFPSPYTQEDCEYWINHTREVKESGTAEHFGIYIDWLYAWNIWRDIKQQWRFSHNYHFGYWLWEPYWWKWYMTQIVQWFIKHIFETRKNAHRIYAQVYWRNEWSKKVLQKCWFTHDWTLRKTIYWDWEFYDEWVFSLLREEYSTIL